MDEIDQLLNSASKSLAANINPVAKKSIEEEVRSIPKLQSTMTGPRVVKTAPTTLKALSGKEKPVKKEDAGAQWFNLGRPELTSEVKRDLQLLRMRHVFDPKRFYKNADEQSKYFAIGTLKEDATEFYSARTNRKDRQQTLAQEVLSSRPDYFKSRYGKIQQKKKSGGKAHYKKLKSKRA